MSTFRYGSVKDIEWGVSLKTRFAALHIAVRNPGPGPSDGTKELRYD